MMPRIGEAPGQGAVHSPVHLNGDFDWDRFDAQDYFQHNYQTMREDDAIMLDLVRDWFAAAIPRGAEALAGIDVGSGTNLYPALAQLHYCHAVTLYEYSKENVKWLKESVRDLPDSWRPFWDESSPSASEQSFDKVGTQVVQRCEVVQGSIFDLPEEQWGIGTMFFVAESLTEDLDEFDRALGCFVRALKPGAPFAAAFMERSEGYDVGDTYFPAVSIDEDRLVKSFNALDAVTELKVDRVGIDPVPLRPGYSGYLVAIGKIKG
jgi:NNMT/PNMT/TEMT family